MNSNLISEIQRSALKVMEKSGSSKLQEMTSVDCNTKSQIF